MRLQLTPQQLDQRRAAGRASGIARGGQRKKTIINVLNLLEMHFRGIPARLASIPGLDDDTREKVSSSMNEVLNEIKKEANNPKLRS